ncbi:MAG: type II toxin-antitoxin system MqsA family antitoxin [Rickettsia sp.]|jgi:putative transcriptional regulator|nr:type II toxin-antitoxin system MqsA family antitoxin [Rickettsia sp.]
MKAKKRDIGAELLSAIKDIKKGKGTIKTIKSNNEIINIRKQLCYSQKEFSELMCINLRTLQEWEQGRCKPRGSAISLLRIVQKHPEIFLDLN